jgi:DNA-binding PadR family transcriptional regulator
MKNYGTLMAKALGILATGFVLNLSKDRKQRFKLHRECDRLWYTMDRKQLYHVLRSLRLNGLVKIIKDSQNIEKIYLSEKGKNKWLQYQFRNLKINKTRSWDKKWRMVLFDIPESKRKIRDALRKKLKNLGFLEFQKSVFICPYPSRDEINFVINYFNIEDNVYYIEAPISPDYDFRKYFLLK